MLETMGAWRLVEENSVAPPGPETGGEQNQDALNPTSIPLGEVAPNCTQGPRSYSSSSTLIPIKISGSILRDKREKRGRRGALGEESRGRKKPGERVELSVPL